MKKHYNVEWLEQVTYNDLRVEDVLLHALNRGLKNVVVIGYYEDGSEYFKSSYASGSDTVWHCNRVIHKLMKISDGQE
ncbi:MAG: hypothetical protein WBP57_11875 [Ignavibacteria bacterium]